MKLPIKINVKRRLANLINKRSQHSDRLREAMACKSNEKTQKMRDISVPAIPSRIQSLVGEFTHKMDNELTKYLIKCRFSIA